MRPIAHRDHIADGRNAWNIRAKQIVDEDVAAIELDDKSHEASLRGETDRKKDRATEAAGIRLLRWHVKALPDMAAIRAAFARTAE